ncbi:MAG: hypothetical protein ACSHX0_11640, partial [Akkermansiaceae bacterium]
GSLWHSGTGNTYGMAAITTATLGNNAINSSAYAGAIDEVQLYNIELSASDVNSLYEVYEGFHKWISGYTHLEDPNIVGGSDNDDIPALLEYVLNGHPHIPDPYILPTQERVGDNFIFRFTRRSESTSYTSQVFQYSTNLIEWHDIDITSNAAPEVSLGIEIDESEEVEITLSHDKAEEGKIFSRLKVNNN